ncbi:phage tail protein [Vibrio splendidus]
MSQTAIPLEFEQYLQNKVSLGEPTDLNEIIFAMIPNLDLSKPIDRTVGLPPLEQWVYQQDVDQVGKSGINSVVYSVVIQGSQEPFTFNAMFLRDKNVPDSCGMVVYKATETKEVSMALTKSMLMQFDGAASAANVTVDAATWQIDYQARLGGMDEEHRLACLDNYGHTAFVDGFDVTRHDVDQNKYLFSPGVVYVGGLRVQNTLVVAHNVTQKPTTLWLDVHRDGTALSTHENQFKVVASSTDLVDYVDGDGLQHYVCKLAGVEADGSVIDLRVKGGLGEHVADSDPHPQYHKNGDHGVGASNGLRGTIYELGTPEQLFGTGFVCGIARGGPDGVGIPQIAHDDFYGTLISNFQYGDSTGSGACNRMFISRFGMFVQTVAEENWVEWRQIYDNKTLPSLSKQGSQFALYDSERVYLPYETCITVSDGKVSIWEAYSNLPFSGKNPSDSQNRPEGWIDPDPNKPFYWIPHHMYLPGETIQIGTTNREEWMLPAHATLLNKNKYWRIAERHPEWLHSDGINLLPPDERGLHLRNIDDGSGIVPGGLLVDEIHADQNRQHSHYANGGAVSEGGFDGDIVSSSSWTMRYTTPYQKKGTGSSATALSVEGGSEVRVKSIGKYAVRAI